MQGRVCEFVPKAEWDEEVRRDVKLPNVVLDHKVVVVGKKAAGWVYVATVRTLVEHIL